MFTLVFLALFNCTNGFFANLTNVLALFYECTLTVDCKMLLGGENVPNNIRLGTKTCHERIFYQ